MKFRPIHELLVVTKYTKPALIRGLWTNPAWRQDNSRSLWEVVQSSPEADAAARINLMPGWILVTQRNSGVFLDYEERVREEDGRPDRRERFLLHAGSILRIIPWTTKEEEVKTLGKRLLVEPDNVAEKSGPIIIPEGSKMPTCTGVVKEIGPEVTVVSAGDRILYSLYSGTYLEVNGARRLILDETSAMGIVDEGEKVEAA